MEMKLQEFVSETLREIIAGVKEAQTYAKDNGAIVNPMPEHLVRDKDKYATVMVAPQEWECSLIKDIDFDVAVTSTDTSETQAGAGIFVAAFGLGVKDKSDTVNSCVSRIKFSVPLALPTNKRG
jgi:hypothetical protein